MKRYKTWEVFKMLSENHGLKFKLVQNRSDVNFAITTISGLSNIFFAALADGKPWQINGGITTTSEWELVKKPVSFMEAVKAYKGGLTISCEVGIGRFLYIPDKNNGYFLRCEDGTAINTIAILDGKWFIEGDEE